MTSRKYISLSIIIGIILVIIALITMYSPWLTDNEVRQIVRNNPNFVQNHEKINHEISDNQIHITHIPFGRWVTTFEGGWFVGFWNGL